MIKKFRNVKEVREFSLQLEIIVEYGFVWFGKLKTERAHIQKFFKIHFLKR